MSETQEVEAPIVIEDSAPKSRLTYYPSASASDPTTFLRVPFDRRPQWLDLWNASGRADAVSCMDAFNTMAYRATVAAMFRNLYNDGTVSEMRDAVTDFNLCLDITGLNRTKPEAAQALLDASLAKADDEPPHVFKFRAEPRFFGLLDFYRVDLTGEEERKAREAAAAAEAAAAEAAAAAAAADAASKAAASVQAPASGGSWWRFWG